MAVNTQKIRLGAPDAMLLFTQYDLGASLGGAELDYTPTIFQVEIDQAIQPVKTFRTKEECSFTVALLQSQASIMLAAFGYDPAGVVTVVAGSLASATAPTVTPQGAAGAVTYSYAIIAMNSNGDAIPSPIGTTATGNATLSAINFNLITWAAVPNATGYKIQRTVGGTTQGIIGTVLNGSVTSFSDTGLAATAYTAAVANPTTPNTDTAYWGGSVAPKQGPFDWAIPKNDGTSLHIRGHFNQCVSGKAQKLDYKRDKSTEINKVSLIALADLTQPVGQQGGYLQEER